MFTLRLSFSGQAVHRVYSTQGQEAFLEGNQQAFDAFCCHPGIEGAHEKGGVEGEGGRFRRNHLVPVPKVDSLTELNELLKTYDLTDDARRIGNRTLSVAEHFMFERDLLRPLPTEAFETGLKRPGINGDFEATGEWSGAST